MPDAFNKGGITPEESVIMRKAADYCSMQEHCCSEVEQKLRLWQTEEPMIAGIISRLLNEGFINEKRYASAFARGKFRNLQWGRVKIRFELRQKKIPATIINQALEDLGEEEYMQVLKEIVDKKLKSLGGRTRGNQLKAMRFAAGKGFEPDLIRKTLQDDPDT